MQLVNCQVANIAANFSTSQTLFRPSHLCREYFSLFLGDLVELHQNHFFFLKYKYVAAVEAAMQLVAIK
jgi:hypothetical protein